MRQFGKLVTTGNIGKTNSGSSQTIHQAVGNSCSPSPGVDFWTLLASSHISGNQEVNKMNEEGKTKIFKKNIGLFWSKFIISPDSGLVPQIAHLGLVTARRPLLHNVIKVLLLFVFVSCISSTMYLYLLGVVVFASFVIHCLHFCQYHLSAVATLPCKSGWLGFYKQAVLLRYVSLYVFVFLHLFLLLRRGLGF